MTVAAHAKVNFTLEVFGRRADGYHALRSVVMPIALADTLAIEATGDGSVSSDTGYADDLCVKAARILRTSVPGLPSSLGARVRVVKRIPAGGGLGGGSADAAAVLRALNELWGLKLTGAALAEVGVRVGSDVPSLVVGGCVVMEGRGERVEPVGLKAKPLDLILVDPGVPCSTAEVYAACADRPPAGPDKAAEMVAALRSGDLGRIAAATMNDLQAPAVRLHSEIDAALRLLREAGALGVTMTGSGSCVFGLAPDGWEARRIAAVLSARGLRAQALATVPAEPCARAISPAVRI